jgi:hypothetical protein
MSNSATSAAKRRRAGPLLASPLFQSPNSFQSNQENQTQLPEPEQQSLNSGRGLTLQQCINLIDNRLVKLEKGTLSQPVNETVVKDNNSDNSNELLLNTFTGLLNQHVEEFNHRYEILASEFALLKDTVMGLQSYTMDINKTLIEERIRILSDIKSNPISIDEEIKDTSVIPTELLEESTVALNEVFDENMNLEMKEETTIIQSKKKGGKKGNHVSLTEVIA